MDTDNSMKEIEKKLMKEVEKALMKAFENVIAEKDKTIEVLTKHNDDLRSLHHSMRVRLNAISKYVRQHAARSYSEGFDENASLELLTILGGVQQLSAEFEVETERIAPKKLLPKTGVHMLDIMFEHFSQICFEQKIDFTLNLWDGVLEMTQNIIPSRKLEILVSNHVTNALESINESMDTNNNNNLHRLTITIGKRGEYFVFSVFDSGTPFTPKTLMKIGTEPTTTRRGLHGGIGFQESFKIMDEYEVSLSIMERELNDNGSFTKAVTFRFDNQNQYTITTYRPNDFEKSDRYTIYEN